MDALLCAWCRKEYAGQYVLGKASHGMCWECYRKEMGKMIMSGYSDANRMMMDVYGVHNVSGMGMNK